MYFKNQPKFLGDSPSLAIIGLQWGDEGKGKISDCLGMFFDVFVRFNGGNNAGHTVLIGDKTYKFSLVPSAVLRDGKYGFIAGGVVVDPVFLSKEIMSLTSQGIKISPENLIVSDTCPLLLSLHRKTDQAFEKMRGEDAIGTTMRGIGSCYADKAARRVMRLCDLFNPSSWIERVKILTEYHNIIYKAIGMEITQTEDILDELEAAKNLIGDYVKYSTNFLRDSIKSGKKIAFEGAQGALLDLEYGTYPFVTSSSTLSSNIGTTGFNLQNGFPYVLGVVKGYSTRVGNGPFPTEMNGEIASHVFNKGKETGTISGRARRCGWFDAVTVRSAAQINSTSGLAITKLDVLSNIDEIKICTGYKINGKHYDFLPSDCSILKDLEPIYESFAGWDQVSKKENPTSIDDLHINVRNYIAAIESLVGIKPAVISFGAERESTLYI